MHLYMVTTSQFCGMRHALIQFCGRKTMVVITIISEKDVQMKHGGHLIVKPVGIQVTFLPNVFQLVKTVTEKFDLLCMTYTQPVMNIRRQFDYFRTSFNISNWGELKICVYLLCVYSDVTQWSPFCLGTRVLSNYVLCAWTWYGTYGWTGYGTSVPNHYHSVYSRARIIFLRAEITIIFYNSPFCNPKS